MGEESTGLISRTGLWSAAACQHVMPNAIRKQYAPEGEGHFAHHAAHHPGMGHYMPVHMPHHYPPMGMHHPMHHPMHPMHHHMSGSQLPPGHHDPYAHLVGGGRIGAHPHAPFEKSHGLLSTAEQMETLIKMVLNAIIVQSEDEVFVPYGIAKKDAAGKVGGSSGAAQGGEGGSASHGGDAGAAEQGGNANAEPAHGANVAAGQGGDADAANPAAATSLSSGKDEGAKGKSGGKNDEVTDDLIGILRACLKKAEEEPELNLKKHVNKILKAPPFHMASGPVYFYTHNTPKNELERADRTFMVRGWAYRDPLTDERVLLEGLRRIPAIYRVDQDENAHCKAGMHALDAATQAVTALPHKKAMRSRRIKGSRGFKPLSPDEVDKECEAGSESWSWKRVDNGRLEWCDRKERRWFKCSQCKFMRENRAAVKQHFEASCLEVSFSRLFPGGVGLVQMLCVCARCCVCVRAAGAHV